MTTKQYSLVHCENELLSPGPEPEKFKYGRADEYVFLERIGEGSYGIVHRGLEKKTGRVVAMKEEIHGISASLLREIEILQSLVGHPRFVEFIQVVKDEVGRVYVVMEYIEYDLERFLNIMTGGFTAWDAKHLMKQLLEGVSFLHRNGIMHRDLKPSNILLSPDDGKLKICDFGLSTRFVRKVDKYSSNVVTLWYRAPELLKGEERYSCAIDMWSVGCIMAELLLNQVLFPGDLESDQLEKILETLGNQSLSLWPQVFDKKFHMLSLKGINLLRRLLACNPNHRITAEEALNHEWFTESELSTSKDS